MTFANAARKLRIKGTEFIWFDEGAYGVVFVDKARKRVRKIYKAIDGKPLAHCLEVFEAETQAYDIASRSDDLKAIVPVYYGKCEELVIMDGTGNDVTGELHPHLAFESEFIEGRFVKSSFASEAERDRINELFWKSKILHTIDTSVCLTDGKITKVIDFAMKEIELWAT
ncbi:hypothetical protein P0R31_00665 [Bradyrhizobium yuanmingense]|uniref:hypothetical protein n=1 Tax=Bradyrhizobium yuanmingense TaxID=108015 RepID=UPI0023B9F9FE|nr:hypothetical protein [Bradyrhizobium yuanmingense]MDF0515753.1 hypothetical protein [Bradyrhizobium yuanmingense]